MPAVGTKRRIAVAQSLGRYRSKADMRRRCASTGLGALGPVADLRALLDCGVAVFGDLTASGRHAISLCDQQGQPDRNDHILPCPRLMVWRITGAVTWSEIWMFHISLSPCAAKSANSFGITDTSRISWPRRSKPRAIFSIAGRPNHSQPTVEAAGPQFVNPRAVSAVVHRADQDAKSLTLERLELLDMEQEPAVSFEQHDLALAALPARSRNPNRIRQAV